MNTNTQLSNEEFLAGLPKLENGTINKTAMTVPDKLRLMKLEMAVRVAEAKDIAQLTNLEKQMSNDKFIAREVLKAECLQITSELDLLREQGITIRGQYGIGDHNGLLASLATSIYFAKVQDKEDAIISRGLSILTLEALVNAVGGAPYYNADFHEIVEARETDCIALAKALEDFSLEMGYSGDIEETKITAKAIQERNEMEYARAVKMHENTERLATKNTLLGALDSKADEDDTPTQVIPDEDEPIETDADDLPDVNAEDAIDGVEKDLETIVVVDGGKA